MRKIKFRAWDKTNKKMLYDNIAIVDGDVGELGVGGDFWINKDLILQQYTGLKDKNCKEIYDGDIVINSNLGIKGYKNIGLNGNVVNIFDWANMRCLTEYVNEDEREVIGNIFENPELIK